MKKKNCWKLAALAALAPAFSAAQERVTADVGADLVSSYVWRGQDLGGAALQPALSIGYRGFSLSGWGSVGFSRSDTKEFDLTLAYRYKGFSVSVTDYWFDGGAGYFHYGAHRTSHVFEAQLGYDFSVVAVNWYTNFAGNDGTDSKGKRAYSSYLALSAPFSLGGIDWTAEVGAVPWETNFYNRTEERQSGARGFEIAQVALQAGKEIRLTDAFSLPVFGRVAWNPATEGAYFVFGLSLK